MDDTTLQQELAAVERRQSVILAPLVGLYLLGGLWVLVETSETVTVWTAAVAVVLFGVVAAVVGVARRRRRRSAG